MDNQASVWTVLMATSPAPRRFREPLMKQRIRDRPTEDFYLSVLPLRGTMA